MVYLSDIVLYIAKIPKPFISAINNIVQHILLLGV